MTLTQSIQAIEKINKEYGLNIKDTKKWLNDMEFGNLLFSYVHSTSSEQREDIMDEIIDYHYEVTVLGKETAKAKAKYVCENKECFVHTFWDDAGFTSTCCPNCGQNLCVSL